MSEQSLYDQLLPSWMDLQWAIRDYNKLLKQSPTRLTPERFETYDRMMNMHAAWGRAVSTIVGPYAADHLEWGNYSLVSEAGDCIVAGTMLFHKY